MSTKAPSRYVVMGLFLILAITNFYFGVALPRGIAAAKSAAPEVPPPPPVKAILKIGGNKPISVNGVAATDGATILTGSIIETPDQVGAVISLGSAGDLEVEPGTKLTLEFDENGNMKVTVARGCATARAKKNIVAEVYTSQGLAGTTDHKGRKALTVCFPPGATAPTVSVPAGAAAASNGIGLVDVVAISVLGTGIVLVLRGTNPSPSGP